MYARANGPAAFLTTTTTCRGPFPGRLAPGKETEIHWYEPGCTDEYLYKLSENKLEGDLFEQAGRDQVFSVAHPVIEAGDHLVTIYSDATCRYLLRVDVNRQ
jgi:hypothetical protein